MSSDTRSARERFVEAMRRMRPYALLCEQYDRANNIEPGENLRTQAAAIDAFADAECGHREIDIEDAFKPGGHVACRAALRKECGL